MNKRDRKNEELKKQWWAQKDIYEAAYQIERDIEDEEDTILVRDDHESPECVAQLAEINQRFWQARAVQEAEHRKLRSIERQMPQGLVKILEHRWWHKLPMNPEDDFFEELADLIIEDCQPCTPEPGEA